MPDFERLPSGLVVPASFAERPVRIQRPEFREIATTLDGRDITRGFVDGLPLLPPQDPILRVRGGGDYRTYEEILRDDQVKTAFEQRRLGVVSRAWNVQPGDDSPRAAEAADFMREQLDRIAWDSVTDKMLFGGFYGFAVAELLYTRRDNQVWAERVKVRKQRRFGFDPQGGLRLRTSSQPDGELVPPNKFWSFCTGADNDDEPYGLGLAHWLYWPVFFKRNGLKFWLIFLEKFGQPTAKGTYPPNAQADERSRLLQALRAISTDAGIIVPEGMQIELIEAARSGSADYADVYDRMNAAISKVILGQTMTTDAAGGQYKAEVHMEVRQDLVKADADLVCQSWNLGPARWLTFWNFGPGVAPPLVYREIEESEDLDKVATRDKTLADIGFRPTLERVTNTYGEGYEDVGPPKALPAPTPPAFAEPQPDPADHLADNLEAQSSAVLDRLVEPVRRLVMGASSLQEIRDGLGRLYPDIDHQAFAELLGQALTVAELAGRFEVSQGR